MTSSAVDNLLKHLQGSAPGLFNPWHERTLDDWDYCDGGMSPPEARIGRLIRHCSNPRARLVRDGVALQPEMEPFNPDDIVSLIREFLFSPAAACLRAAAGAANDAQAWEDSCP